MPLFVVVLLKRTIYNKQRKREAENERRENERSQNGHKKTLTADSAPDPPFWGLFKINRNCCLSVKLTRNPESPCSTSRQ